MLLVDAYNVLMTPGVLPPALAGMDLPGLADLIARSRYARHAVRLVCDGSPSGPVRPAPVSIKGAEVLYAGPGREADDLIEQILRSDAGVRGMLVVSSDRRIQRSAKRRRARVLSSEAFLAHLVADEDRRAPKPRPAFAQAIPLDRGSVAYWLREFGFAAEADAQTLPAPQGDPSGVLLANGRPKPRPMPPPSGQATPPPLNGIAGFAPPPPADSPSTAIDPILLEAMRMWPGRVRPDDLDMDKWLGPEGGQDGKPRSRPQRG